MGSKEKNAIEIENTELKDNKSKNKIAKPIIKESEKNINNFLVNAMNDISDLEIKKEKNATENIEIIKPTIKDKNIEMSDVSKEKNAIEIENNELKNDKSNKIAKPIIKESKKNINNFLVNAMNDISDLEIKKEKNATENIEII